MAKKPKPPVDEALVQQWADRINATWRRAKQEAAIEKAMERKPRGPSGESQKVELPLAAMLRSMGHVVRRQVSCAGGRIDILDDTAEEIIECKADGELSSIVDAARQLKLYQPSFPNRRLCIAVPFIDPRAMWMADALRKAGFRFIELERGL
jgi:hypothetical protein